MDEKITFILFEKKVENENYNFKDEEFITHKKEMQDCMEQLSTFIDNNIQIGTRKKLKDLIENYYNAAFDCFYCKNRLYYNEGFSDCTKLICESLNN